MGNGVAEVALYIYAIFFLVFVVAPVCSILFLIWFIKKLKQFWDAC